jgi:hypothetical protein
MMNQISLTQFDKITFYLYFFFLKIFKNIEGKLFLSNENDSSTGKITLTKCIFENCYSSGSGGVVYLLCFKLIVTECVFTSCSSKSDGGFF